MRAYRHGIPIASIVLASAPLWAHHAAAADYDLTKLTVLQGIVSRVEWINPHAQLHLDVKDSNGKVIPWQIEGASMNAYAVRNFPKELVTAGIEISAYPAKNGDKMADGATITFKDGRRVFFGGSAPVDGLDEEGRPCIVRRNTACRH